MKIIVLDRDGVINEDSDSYIKSDKEWVPLPGSIQAIARFSKAGYRVFVATNQSGLARGLFSEIDLARMHQKMSLLVEEAGGYIEGVVFCPHLPTENCNCRKPNTGLLEQIEQEFACSLKGAPFVGDSVKDVQAGNSHGCESILVKTGKGGESFLKLAESKEYAYSVFEDLAAYADSLLESTHD